MQEGPRLEVTYPCRVPIKVIGKIGVLDPTRVAEVIESFLGPLPPDDRSPAANQKGTYISYTFWVVLPDEGLERPLREAIQVLPGYVMQL